MTHSLIGKFAWVFWLLFIAVIAPIFIFIQINVSSSLNESEKAKIELVTQTLKPIISTYLAFDQQEMLSDTMRTFFQNPNILDVSLLDSDKKVIFEQHYPHSHIHETTTFSTPIIDPISHQYQATLNISYSNNYVHELQTKLFMQIIFLSLFALLIFAITFWYFRKQFFVLRQLSNWMGNYTIDKYSEPFKSDNPNTEIKTITSSANKMLESIENYRVQMEQINIGLEHRVESEIIKRREKEQLLIQQSRLAAMGEMIESIAHQWRQPLNIIGLAVADINVKRALGLIKNDDFEKNTTLINNNLAFMSNTIDDFRNFFNKNKESVYFDPIQPIQEIFNLLGEQLHYANISYFVHKECEGEIFGVVNEFKQVILNLVNNAKDAIKSKSDRSGGVIDVTLRCDATHIFIEISDTGGGVPSAIVERIFEPYFTTKLHSKGTGIGLYMSKVIVEQHLEGTLSVSNNDVGAVFTLTMALRR
ncbi:HAMP domain-containing sensor histidine kinase [Sulfuricurvum sp.]|uniref:HAMP domain-containing sensor histidine kinase n=1 Tax=Sulfuricurvum sp. TaxID=2025608 RepID=UPI002D5BC74B|nr:HAMP domain-containing sensor histidine kinase [Sulfuricurvum sp.]HZF70344.1 HAMP domain-containing sensor histidine kinase [Sulfuricurvum sp.]